MKAMPGPWRADRVLSGGHIEICAGRYCVGHAVGAHDSVLHNAQLMATAPDLREALEGLLSVVNDSQGVAGYHINGAVATWDEFEEVGDAIAALAKATAIDKVRRAS